MKRPRVGILEALIPILITLPEAAWAADGATPALGQLALRAGASLAAVVGLIVLLAVLVRKFKAIPGAVSSGGRLASLARLDLGARREIRLVRVDEKTLVVGVTGDRIELLCEVEGRLEDAESTSGRKPALQILRELTTSS